MWKLPFGNLKLRYVFQKHGIPEGIILEGEAGGVWRLLEEAERLSPDWKRVGADSSKSKMHTTLAGGRCRDPIREWLRGPEGVGLQPPASQEQWWLGSSFVRKLQNWSPSLSPSAWDTKFRWSTWGPVVWGPFDICVKLPGLRQDPRERGELHLHGLLLPG